MIGAIEKTVKCRQKDFQFRKLSLLGKIQLNQNNYCWNITSLIQKRFGMKQNPCCTIPFNFTSVLKKSNYDQIGARFR